MGILKECGIKTSKKNNNSNARKVEQIFEKLFAGKKFTDIEYSSPCDYVSKYWNEYKCYEEREKEKANEFNSIRGGVFELIIYTLLYREGIVPFYTQAKVHFVPNVEYDAILYREKNPISISLKTSLRERYKQADLEAIALKYVHRKAICYLLTIDSEDAKRVSKKVESGDIIGLDEIVDCNGIQLNTMIEKLHTMKYKVSDCVSVVEGTLVNKEN